MKKFIINLKHRTDKKKFMQDQIQNLKITNYEFVDAINGNDLLDTELMKTVFNYPDCALTKTEIGCAMSHLSIYKKMIECNTDLALILEDDAVLSDNINLVLGKISVSKKPEIYLLSEVKKFLRKPLKHSCFHQVINAYGAHGYVINLPAAKSLIHNNGNICFQVDIWGEFLKRKWINLLTLPSPIITTNDTDRINSDIEEDRIKLNKKRKKQLKIIKKNISPYYKARWLLLKLKYLIIGIEKRQY